MGWISYQATHYKNGKIDRVAEVESQLVWGENAVSDYKVLKTCAVGSVIYSAVERVHKETKEKQVFATIFLTSTNMKDYYNFSYKDMDETCGPCESKCPISILKLLTPTEYEWANQWRERCYEYHNSRNNPTQNINKLPLGTKIKMKYWDKPKADKDGYVELVKTKYGRYANPIWLCNSLWCKFKPSQIQSCGFEILEIPTISDEEKLNIIIETKAKSFQKAKTRTKRDNMFQNLIKLAQKHNFEIENPQYQEENTITLKFPTVELSTRYVNNQSIGYSFKFLR